MSGANSSKKPGGIHEVRYGKVVKVHGGHILRSIPGKDGHSKVLTSKGARDRRFRLSAPTAIQFYDVQDRLGYDRPGKVVDWLIDKAKAAIEDLPAGKQLTEQEEEHPLQGSNCEPKLMNDDSLKEAVVVDGDGDDPYELSQVNYCEEAFDSASNHLSESKVMEMAQMQGWFQSLMAGWNYNAGEAGEVCPFKSSHLSLQHPY